MHRSRSLRLPDRIRSWTGTHYRWWRVSPSRSGYRRATTAATGGISDEKEARIGGKAKHYRIVDKIGEGVEEGDPEAIADLEAFEAELSTCR